MHNDKGWSCRNGRTDKRVEIEQACTRPREHRKVDICA